ncbi:hypothetical protein NDU88_005774 [Pleurodeles waltl]|uniref:Uncharacterized protein n=1 Tax=Pleurodeles waltl TaxID=8319 RepID=A0AAV7L431_PLEWA|nr:hypothetical protein NDU88_005774 [Pleurodeles waltl]
MGSPPPIHHPALPPSAHLTARPWLPGSVTQSASSPDPASSALASDPARSALPVVAVPAATHSVPGRPPTKPDTTLPEPQALPRSPAVGHFERGLP